MEFPSSYKLCAATAALAVGCTFSYIAYKRRGRVRNANDVFNYLTVEIVTTEESCDSVVAELKRRCQKHHALGFDCEWVTNNGKRQPVALVQLSSFDGYCGLFRLNTLKAVPLSLKELLEDESIYKVGVGPKDDSKYLHNDYSVELRSSLDIRHLAEYCGYEPGGLATLSSVLLRAALDKSWRVRCSDWEAEELSERQKKYAAIDAHVAIKLFALLLEKVEETYSNYWELDYNPATVWTRLYDYCSKYADVGYKTKHTIKLKDHAKEKDPKIKEPTKRYKLTKRTRPLYNNGYLQAPDGELLCICDNRKGMWFVNKGLADLIKEDPLTVRLKFEPAGRAVGDVGRYYQLEKENKCVVCASTNHCIRKNVVPREYRKLFPEIMKEHSSHDVVLLCAECHQMSNIRDQHMRVSLAEKCNAPLPSSSKDRFIEDMAAKKVRSAARALYHANDKLPEDRRKQLEDILLQHYPDQEEVTLELLKEACNITVVRENTDYESHGIKVVDYYFKRASILKLEQEWREHFLKNMKPKYMPALWSVKHNEERLRVKWDEGRLTREDMRSIGLTTF
ncbi:unnamed protein product [Spodoptera littoralis]|uniref:3'-5' exonuclease domain-containing protein n=1 Tax=Spodoptera littoralis TaxID=7109 RepID=A0A9P0N5H8_SPOLI|nr:unnamed protein product [Spodoptera littoralis]CAH1643173.1 unnamed protein product [Spodoptera littoralis]